MPNIAGTGSIIGDIAELIAEVLSRAGTNPAEVKKLLVKEFTGRQLVEDVGNFGSLVKQKGFGGAIGEGVKTTADTLLRRSGKYPAQSALGWGYTLPYTGYAVNESLNDPNAGPAERYMRAGAEAVLNPLTINPRMGFTTAMALNYGGPQLLGGAGKMIDKAVGSTPKVASPGSALFYALAKVAIWRKVAAEEMQAPAVQAGPPGSAPLTSLNKTVGLGRVARHATGYLNPGEMLHSGAKPAFKGFAGTVMDDIGKIFTTAKGSPVRSGAGFLGAQLPGTLADVGQYAAGAGYPQSSDFPGASTASKAWNATGGKVIGKTLNKMMPNEFSANSADISPDFTGALGNVTSMISVPAAATYLGGAAAGPLGAAAIPAAKMVGGVAGDFAGSRAQIPGKSPMGTPAMYNWGQETVQSLPNLLGFGSPGAEPPPATVTRPTATERSVPRPVLPRTTGLQSR